ncbi:MAG: hypothetical protein P4L82_11985 [Ancalomicrobiaceae bacterium]|nr:hypothetical protein [Ancalomicrobiaceae bacterium]
MKFYTRDWANDPALRMVSLAAQGLWIRILCIMHEAEPYGHLVINGGKIENHALARIVGAMPDEVSTLVDELRNAGVCSMRRDGTLVSRRMVRDERVAKKGAKAVATRWNQVSDDKGEFAPCNRVGRSTPITQRFRGQKSEGQNREFRDTGSGGRDAAPSPPAEAASFPSDGSVRFSEPWYGLFKKTGRNIDIDLLASRFREFLREKDIPFDSKGMDKRWVTFIGKHRVDSS